MVGQRRLWRLHRRLQARLPMWVVYRPTARGFLGHWVARMHLMLPEPRSTRFMILHASRDGLREMLPPGLTMLPRDPDDVPEIEEVWL